MKDRVIGKALSFDCRIGLHEHERQITQRLYVDFEVETDWRESAVLDEPVRIVNYYEVNQRLEELLASRRFKLIEAVAEEASKMICQHFPVSSVRLKVTKMPFDMPNVGEVAVECFRRPEDFIS